MATTVTDLYRSLIGDAAKKLKIRYGMYPGDGVLSPRWESKPRLKADGTKTIDVADVKFGVGEQGEPVVMPGGGTSLHDVPGWFSGKEFWIPAGTEYSDEIYIREETKLKTSTQNPDVRGYHYQLEVRKPMTRTMFEGYLNNMARAAVVRQVELAKAQV